MFHEALEDISEHHKLLFPFGIRSVDVIHVHCGLNQLFCRGLAMQAISQGASELDIQVTNHWSKHNK